MCSRLYPKVLQNLLAEQVSIRDMRSIVECLAEHAPQQTMWTC
ncbi:MAG: hypothetical protein GPOALKHO_001741 [Sodalis sp.]|nr:MAG: hypothetical protein GPOALKHO_001741 [Sodalis sp.]